MSHAVASPAPPALRPLVRLMGRLRFPQKVLLVSSVLLLPLAIVFTLYVRDLRRAAELTNRELAGVRLLRAERTFAEPLGAVAIIASTPVSLGRTTPVLKSVFWIETLGRVMCWPFRRLVVDA